MIVFDEGDVHRVITQPDHARFAGELVALWRDHGMPDHPRRDDLLFAVREHDNGWREADAAPSWNATAGRPHDFLSMPDERRREIWRRGTLRFAAVRPYAALLVTLHGLALATAYGEPSAELVAELEERADELAEACGARRTEAADDYRILAFADAASLVVANRWTDAIEQPAPGWMAIEGGTLRGRFEVATETLYLDPFPLAGATRFALPVRRIPKRPYAGDADLGGTLAAARWESLAVRVSPPGIPG
ncbi:MAG TPA: DUF3891 family protein [Thermoanaerobaculia bacterium]|nr:DUF3891 family protein [Thermoanaerobaculia bacterium]